MRRQRAGRARPGRCYRALDAWVLDSKNSATAQAGDRTLPVCRCTQFSGCERLLCTHAALPCLPGFLMVILLVIWLFFGIGASMVASNRGADGCLWFGLGVLLGPFGLAFAFAAGSDRRCQFCQKRIHPKAIKCPYCQSQLSQSQPQSTTANARLNDGRCPRCGTFILQDSKFCSGCGTTVLR
jgi:Double zinc ribbon